MWQIQWRSVLRRYQTPEQLSCTLSTFQIMFYNYELPTSCNLLRSSRVLSDLVSWNFLQISFSSFSQYFFVSSSTRRILTPISVLLKNGKKKSSSEYFKTDYHVYYGSLVQRCVLFVRVNHRANYLKFCTNKGVHCNLVCNFYQRWTKLNLLHTCCCTQNSESRAIFIFDFLWSRRNWRNWKDDFKLQFSWNILSRRHLKVIW